MTVIGQRDINPLRACRTPAFEDGNPDALSLRSKRETQGGRRGLFACCQGTEHEKKRLAGLGGQVQPAQLGHPDRVAPQNQCSAAIVAQHLLGGPPGIAIASGINAQQALGGQIPGRPAQSIGSERRMQQHHGTIGAGVGEGRLQQTDLADAVRPHEQFGQGADRPAGAGQLGIERGVAGRDCGPCARTELGAAPERRMDVLR